MPTPCNCTTAFSLTVWLLPAATVGGRFTWETDTLAVAVADAPRASVTTSWKVNVAFPVTVGTRNCACAELPLTMPTGGPPVWNHKKDRASRSPSFEPLPSRVTVVRSSAVVGAVARAFGPWFAWITVMVTVDAALLTWPSFTTSENVSVFGVATSGAMNVGFCAVALESTTAGPSVWVHAKVSGLPSASAEPVPSSVTVERAGTVSPVPARATGTRSGLVTVTATSEGRLVATPSLTVSWKTSVATVAAVVETGVRTGAVNVGFTEVGVFSATLGPSSCTQRKLSAVVAELGLVLPLPSSVTFGAPLRTERFGPPRAVGRATTGVQAPVDGTSTSNGLFKTPLKATLSISQPPPAPPASVPMRNRIRIAWFANAVPRLKLVVSIVGNSGLRPPKAWRPPSGLAPLVGRVGFSKTLPLLNAVDPK